MPLYEYYCPHCELVFEQLRPYSQADAPARCPHCGGQDVHRRLSRFASMSVGSDGSVTSLGGGGCASCSATSCANCGR